MPDFYEKMKNKLRTEAQGADTVVWLAVSDAASRQPSGLFFQGQEKFLICIATCHVVESMLNNLCTSNSASV